MQEITLKDYLKTLIYLGILIAIIVLGAIILLPKHYYLWVLIVIISIFTLVKWHADNFAYQCKNCRHKFGISVWLDLISPHGIAWQYLKCPKCHKWSKARILKR